MMRVLFLTTQALLAMMLMPVASAQMPLPDPDLSSLARPYHGGLVLAADIVPGWYYVSGAQVLGGVKTCGGPVSRVSATGIIDQSWCMDEWPRADTYRISGLQVLPSGVLLVQTWWDWRVVRRNAQGRYEIQGLPGIVLENNDQAATLIQGLDGQFYLLVNRGNNRQDIRRLRPDASLDTDWHPTPIDANVRISAFAVSTNGDITSIESQASTPMGPASTALVRRAASGQVLWRTPLADFSFKRELILDRQGRTYGRTRDGSLLRFRSDGQPDSAWPPPALRASQESSWDYLRGGALLDDTLWLARAPPGQGSELVRYDTGLDQANWTQPLAARGRFYDAWHIINNKDLFVLHDSMLHVQRDLQASTSALHLEPLFELASSLTKNDKPYLVRWGTGWLALGNLGYAFEGQALRWALRFDHRQQPDSQWKPALQRRTRDVQGFELGPLAPLFTVLPMVDLRGGLILSGHFDYEGFSHLFRFHADGSLDRGWPVRPNNYVAAMGRGSDGGLFSLVPSLRSTMCRDSVMLASMQRGASTPIGAAWYGSKSCERKASSLVRFNSRTP